MISIAMKIRLLLCFFMLPIAQNIYGDDPNTFEEFKKLSQSERTALLANNAHPSADRIYQWNQRLYLGEKTWRLMRLESLAGQHGFDSTLELFNFYQHLREAYLGQQLTAKQHASASQTEMLNADNQHKNDMKAAASIYQDIAPLVAAMVPSAESKALNKRASELVDQWTAKWPDGGSWTVMPTDMAAVTNSMNNILNQLKAAKKLTPDELQKEIEALSTNISSNANVVPHN